MVSDQTASSADSAALISVILPAHDAASTIDEQMAALCAQRCDERWELIVVANCCEDDTASRVRGWHERFRNLRLIEANEMASAAYARNVGVSAASGQRLLFCDADDVVRPGWVAGMSAALEDASLVGGRLEPLEGAEAELSRVFPVHGRQQSKCLPGLSHDRVRARPPRWRARAAL